MNQYTKTNITFYNPFLGILFFIFSCQLSFADIIPIPQKIKYNLGAFRLKNNVGISFINDLKAENIFSAEIINDALRAGLNFSSYFETNIKNSMIHIVLIDEERAKEHQFPNNKSNEAYYIKVSPELIRIEATTPQGVFYGAATLAQLIEQARDSIIASQEIIDWADMDVRGISDDISRGQVSDLKNFKKIIHQMALHKMNTYFLYVEDMIQFERYSEIGKGRGALSKAEITAIIDYAKKHFIDVIPIFTTFGHQENILSNEQFQGISEFPGATTLCASCDATYQYLDNVLKEIAAIFPSKYIHIGGSESYDAGFGKSKELAKKNGIAGLHAIHYQKVFDICKKYNKKVMMYGDMISKYPELLKKIPKDVVIVDWRNQHSEDFSSVNGFQNANLAYLVSPTVFSFGTTFPLHLLSLTNIQQFIKTGIERQAKGMINANWGYLGAETFKETLYFSYFWSAQCAWNQKASNIHIYSRSFFENYYGEKWASVERVYQILSNPVNAVVWSDFWKHPLLAEKENSLLQLKLPTNAKIISMEWTLSSLENEIDTLKKYLTKNTDQLDILQLMTKMNRYYIFKLQTQAKLQNYFQDKTTSIDLLINELDEHIIRLQNLKTQYENIWQKYYRVEGLKHISNKFTRSIAYLDEIKIELSNQTLKPSPLLESQWLYMCDKTNCYNEAVFRKDLVLDTPILFARLQVIADTYAELIINGQTIDKIFVRNLYAIHLEPQVVKFIDVQEHLKPGKNTIELKVINYNEGYRNVNPQVGTGAGVNVNAFIRTESGKEYKLITDDTWEAKKLNTLNPTEKWQTPTVRPYYLDIIAPYFPLNRESWIER